MEVGEIKIRTSAEYMHMKKGTSADEDKYNFEMIEKKYKHFTTLEVKKIYK